MTSKTIVWITLLMLAVSGLASDLEKEQRWREQVEDSIMEGEAVDLVVPRGAGHPQRTLGLTALPTVGSLCISPDSFSLAVSRSLSRCGL